MAAATPRATVAPAVSGGRDVPALPIEGALPELQVALRDRSVAVLEAPPGAGKTTRVPLALLDAPWMQHQRLLVLEPRRLAARAAAHFMARQLGEQVGDTVGYRVRGELRVSARTRVEVITEGILTRMLSNDPALDGVGAVLFDEFHERSLTADLGLALTLHSQQLLRPELRVLVMSATLDGEGVAHLLADANGSAPIVRSHGRMYPVADHYRAPRPQERLPAHVARVVREAVQEHDGDVLVFLPGAREIRRVGEALDGVPARVHALFGNLSFRDQDAAIAPAPPGERKVVLSTAIAETSLTIEGVRVVVDSGRARLPRYDARVGITRLTTVRVSQASAEQRRGRAGRVAPGVCYRLWDAHEQAMLPPRTRAEILDADLAPLALELAEAGVHDAAELRWLDVPSASSLERARALLQLLGALDAEQRITKHGKAMLALPVHPRLAHMLICAKRMGEGPLAATIAACLEERDLLRGAGAPPPADLALRLELAAGVSSSVLAASLHGATVDRDAVRRVREARRDLVRRLDIPQTRSGDTDVDSAGELLALAFPDRIAQQRAGSSTRFLMRSGGGAVLATGDALSAHPFLVIAELDGAPPEFRVARALPVTRSALESRFVDQLRTERSVRWDADVERVVARRRRTLGALVFEDAPLRDVTDADVRDVLLTVVRDEGVSVLPWGTGATKLRERLAFLHAHDATWPDVSPDALAQGAHEWLADSLLGVRRLDALRDSVLHDALLSLLDWSQRAQLDLLAPTHVTVPSGSRIAVRYEDAAAPVLAVKLQEVFGWTTTPMVCDGRVPLTLHLLSPAQRPVQVTRDLAGFWRDGYFDVRKELRGRYPRHPWPDDPLTAPPTRRTKRR